MDNIFYNQINLKRKANAILSDREIEKFSATDKQDFDAGRGKFFSRDPNVKKAVQNACDVLKSPIDQREKYLATWSEDFADSNSDTECLMAMDVVDAELEANNDDNDDDDDVNVSVSNWTNFRIKVY